MGVSVEFQNPLCGGVTDDVGEPGQSGRLREEPLPQHRQVDVVGLGLGGLGGRGGGGLVVVEMQPVTQCLHTVLSSM